MKIVFAFFTIVIASLHLNAQNYFQQEVNFKIDVELNDKKHELSAFEVVTYKNNSSTTLNEIYFHLYPNAYKNNTTFLAKEYFNVGNDVMLNSEENDFGWIDSLNFKINGNKIEWALLTDTIDICKLKLPSPLHPGESVVISTPFKVKIPSDQLSRLGHNDQAYFITQWFPKPAVFDKNGWNYFSYLNKGEFYSEFGTYDVSITLPSNYVVGASGELVNGAEELNFLDLKAKETSQLNVFPTTMEFPLSSADKKTLHFHQNNIHDFAWFADKRWHVLKGEVELPNSKRKITTWSFFTNAEAEMWKMAPEYIARTIKYMSKWVGEYPYSTCTAVDVNLASGDGMEYPMITAIGSYGDPFELDVTIVHEVAHNWFYGILGSNERYHAWMDEGFTNFCETRYVYTQYANNTQGQLENIGTFNRFNKILPLEKINHKEVQYNGYIAGARNHTDVSQDQPAQKLSRANYRGDVYYKTSVSIDYLKSYLGESLFDSCMNHYYSEWQFKHPDPNDLKTSFEKTSGQNLNWFFDDLMRSNKKIDYSLCSINTQNSSAILSLKNKESINSPLWIRTIHKDQSVKDTLIEGFSGLKKIELPLLPGDNFQIDANHLIPELNRKNNFIRSDGILKSTEKVKFKFFTGIENPARTEIYYMPVLGYNVYNSLMAGIVLHNVSFFEKKFEYAIMPMYATRTKNLAGGADLQYHIYLSNDVLKKITLQETIGHYAYQDDYYSPLNNEYNYHHLNEYTKLDSRIIFKFKGPHPQKKITKEFEIRDVFVKREIAYGYYYRPVTEEYNFVKTEYRRINSNPLDASSQKIAVVFNNQFLKATVELKQFITYGSKSKGAAFRFFGGYANINSTLQRDVDYRYNLSGTQGKNDFLYDDIFIGRTESTGIWSQQFIKTDAGFTTPTLFYRKATKWMFGFNASTTLPGLIPFKLYVNLGTFNDSKLSFIDFKGISYELGVEIPVIKDVLTVYIPFSYSNDIQYVIDKQNYHFGNLIRFELHLQKLNPLNYIRTTY